MANVKHVPRHLRDLAPERIFAAQWEALASSRVPRENIDEDRPTIVTRGQEIAAGHNRGMVIDQAAATLAATFVTWLGTSVGLSFLDLGRRLNEVAGGQVARVQGNAFLAAWSLHNARHFAINNGWRTCEFFAFEGGWNDSRYCLPPEMTAGQLEILENVARWLGTDEGMEFLARCEALVFAESKGLRTADLGKLAAAVTHAVKESSDAQ